MGDTGGLQWFQLRPPLKIIRALYIFMIHVLYIVHYIKTFPTGKIGKISYFSFELSLRHSTADS